MRVKNIIKNYLRINDFDGLVNCEESCGCGIDDLMPALDCNNCEQCQVAKIHICKGEEEECYEHCQFLDRQVGLTCYRPVLRR